MPRIAYVGNFGPAWSTENDVRIALESLGHDVIPLQENAVSYSELGRQAMTSDLLLWTGTWDDAFPLDAVLDVFHSCAAAGIPTATYHLDTFWSTERGGRKWWLAPMFHTGTIFTADGDHEADWAALGKRHRWLRPGVRHTATDLGAPRDAYACDVAFVGSDGHGYHPEWHYRIELVDALEAMCARNGWTFRNPGGRQPKVDRGHMNDFYASAKVTVGDSLCPLREASHYWSDRAYEAPGRGGLLVMPQIDALVADYDNCLPTYPWGDFDTLEQIIAGLLADEGERERVRSTCHRIARQHHTYANRMRDLLEAVGL